MKKSKSQKHTFLGSGFLAIAVLLSACSAGVYKEHYAPASMSLKPDELHALKLDAMNGSAESAERVADYYSFVLFDYPEAINWYRIAMRLGNENANEAVEAIEKWLQQQAAAKQE